MNVEQSQSGTTVALVRALLLSRVRALNNEAVPYIGLAYLAGALRAAGHVVVLIDGIAEGLNSVHPWAGHTGFQLQGITPDDLVARIPANAEVIGFTTMFSAEWVLVRELIDKVRGLQRVADRFAVFEEFDVFRHPDAVAPVPVPFRQTFRDSALQCLVPYLAPVP